MGYVRGDYYAQPPHRLLPLKKILNHFCLDCHSVCDNVYRSLTMFSALAAVRTVDCAIEIVLITLHYITLLYTQRNLSRVPVSALATSAPWRLPLANPNLFLVTLT